MLGINKSINTSSYDCFSLVPWNSDLEVMFIEKNPEFGYVL